MARLGSQTPTQSIVLPYADTKGIEAVDLYETCGRTSQEWQSQLITNIMAIRDDGLWTHQSYGYEVPRQNGKGEILTMREFWGLVHGERICHTAHRTSTSHSAFVRLMTILTDAGYVETGRKKKGREEPQKSFKATKQYGLEQIFLKDGGYIVFRTRTESGGIGESFDLLVIDEAQEYTSTQQSALIYTIAASPNPQTIFCGTPPTPTSSGDVFVKVRQNTISGKRRETGWAEWSVYQIPDDPMDTELWYQTNPSLGSVLRERTIYNEDVGNSLDFVIQRLGYWHSYALKSEISEKDWMRLKTTKKDFSGKLFAAVKFGADGLRASLSIAVNNGEKIFTETIGCHDQSEGFGWIVNFIRACDIYAVVIDGKGKSDLLENELTDAKLKVKVIRPTSAEAVSAYSAFRQAIDEAKVCHGGQPSVTQSVSNCEKRLIGTNGAFGYRSIKENVDVSILESQAFAYWARSTIKERRKQKIGY